jgi:lipid A 3-O-deacylase
MFKFSFLFLLSCLPFFMMAQRISNTVLYRNVSSPRYVRVHYENDYFSTSDLYYTQGVNIEYVHPSFRNSFLSKLLVHSTSKEVKVGITLEQEGYTPSSISHSEILKGDRPFAGCLFFKAFSIVNNPERKERVSSSLSTGFIGPITGSKEIQDGLHSMIDYKLPQGWRNQIRNDIILNYQLEYERELLDIGSHFLLAARAGSQAGTFNTNAYGGIIIMTGRYDNPFTNFSKSQSKNRAWLFAEPLMRVVFYDATLQGGFFNTGSPYTIAARDICRVVFQGNVGIAFKFNTISNHTLPGNLKPATHIFGVVFESHGFTDEPLTIDSFSLSIKMPILPRPTNCMVGKF